MKIPIHVCFPLLMMSTAATAWVTTSSQNQIHQRTVKPSSQSLQVRTSLQQSSTSSSSTPDSQYYSVIKEPLLQSESYYNNNEGEQRITLTRYLNDVVKENPSSQDMVSLLDAVKMACKTIANLVNRAGLSGTVSENKDFSDGRYYSMKRLDQLSTIVLKNALKYTGKCRVVAPAICMQDDVADHQPGVLIAKSVDSHYVACLDPLDGSGNADASICTGTVFGVFEEAQEDKDEDSSSSSKKGQNEKPVDLSLNDQKSSSKQEELVESVLQPAKNMRAAGYCLYSSATVLVFTLGGGTGVQGFTLDPLLQEFVLTHRNLTIPPRGNVYSCNEANSELGWNPQFASYLKALKTGTGETKQRYAHRYVGSMVGDVHRTLLYGGLFCYPSDQVAHPQGNLQLLYKISPLAQIITQAGGRGMDEQGRDLLDLRPERVHQKSPCFMGSKDDIQELESYLIRGGDDKKSGGSLKKEDTTVSSSDSDKKNKLQP